MFVCPSAADAMAGSGDIVKDGYFQAVGWYAVTAGGSPFAETRSMLLCYGMNSQLRQWDMSTPNYGNPNNKQNGDISRLISLKPAAMVPLLAEKRIRPDELPINHPDYQKNLTQTKVTSNRFAARHNKGGNIVFADGHVEWFANSKVDNPQAVKINFYNIPGVIIWNPAQ
jgi:prepilin-type processing-associated H-X9-DG protein